MIPKELTDFIIAVMRKGIECELRGVGIVPYSAFEASKVKDEGLNRYNITAMIKKSVRNRRYHLLILKLLKNIFK